MLPRHGTRKTHHHSKHKVINSRNMHTHIDLCHLKNHFPLSKIGNSAVIPEVNEYINTFFPP